MIRDIRNMIVEASNVVGETLHWEDYDEITCMDGEKINMAQLLEDQERAKASLAVHAPSWGGLLSKLRFVYTFRVKTQATDGEFIFVNPQFTYHLDNTGKVFVMAHELMHCLLQHMRRGKGHDPERSNIAADYEVNSTIVDLGLIRANTILSIGALYDKKYSGMGYETIYNSNPSGSTNGNQSQNNQQQSSKGQGGQSGQQGQSGQSQQGQQGQNSQSQQGQGGQEGQEGQEGRGQSGQGQQGQQGGQSGQGQGGQQSSSGQGGQSGQGGPNTYSTPDGGLGRQVTTADCQGPSSLSQTPGNAGGMFDKNTGDQIAKAEGHKPGQSGMNDDKWKDAALGAARKMQGEGALGALRNKINGIYKTTTDWKSILKKIVGRSISPMNKYQAYTHKNKLASLSQIARTDKDSYDAVDYIAAFIDTSGSMGEEDLKRCLREVYTMALAKKPCRILIIQFDDGISDVQVYNNLKKFEQELKLGKLKLKGGGGTNVQPCFEFLRKDPKFRYNRADCVIIFTDGYLTVHKRDSKTMKNLVWCILDNTSFDLPQNAKDSNTKVIHINTSENK